MAEFKLPKNSEIIEGHDHPKPKTDGEQKTFKIYRWSPDDDENPRIDKLSWAINYLLGEDIYQGTLSWQGNKVSTKFNYDKPKKK